jgi:formylglycine-generating enzyme required for sulfatase activity
MPKIFISYRREETGYPAQHIYEKLVDRFGKDSVVFDVDTIPPGADFRDYINKEVGKCDIMLAIMGNHWIELLEQRTNEPRDFVRIEIQSALDRKIPVVPVFTENAQVPREKDLPPELRDLVYKQAVEVRIGSDYQSQLNRLIDGLKKLFPGSPTVEDFKHVEDKDFDSFPKTVTNIIGMKFVLIPSGRFKMGSGIIPEATARKFSYGNDSVFLFKMEHPHHDVIISRPFQLQATQVSQGQWEKIMGNNPSEYKSWRKNYQKDYPVENVSWNDTQEFIKKLNEMESTSAYRLPSEAEWEYACRAGTTTEFSFGDWIEQLGDYAWFFGNSKKKTHPVGTKKPNQWGLYDMHGNVREWVEDDIHSDYDGAPKDGTPWVDNPRGTHRVIRGGGIHHGEEFCRSAFRDGYQPDVRDNEVGFRLVRSVTFGP